MPVYPRNGRGHWIAISLAMALSWPAALWPASPNGTRRAESHDASSRSILLTCKQLLGGQHHLIYLIHDKLYAILDAGTLEKIATVLENEQASQDPKNQALREAYQAFAENFRLHQEHYHEFLRVPAGEERKKIALADQELAHEPHGLLDSARRLKEAWAARGKMGPPTVPPSGPTPAQSLDVLKGLGIAISKQSERLFNGLPTRAREAFAKNIQSRPLGNAVLYHDPATFGSLPPRYQGLKFNAGGTTYIAVFHRLDGQNFELEWTGTMQQYHQYRRTLPRR